MPSATAAFPERGGRIAAHMPEVIIPEPAQKIPPLGEQAARETFNRRARRVVAFVCAAFALYTAIAPVGRACMLLQVTYNEGWNVYTAQAVVEHRPLFPASPNWTVVNYPALSFYIAAGLSNLTHDFLFTARAISVLSTVLCSLFVGLIVRQMTVRQLMVRQLTRGNWPALIAGLYCFALFCAGANTYVGVDDPQMFAQVFLMAGLFVYVRYRQKFWALMATALLLTIGMNIKHILIEFPLAIFVDLLIVSRRKALQFGIMGAVLAALSVLLNIHFGGPGFIAAMLAPRTYSFEQLLDNLSSMYVPIVLASLIAAAMAFRFRNHPLRRILSILYVTSWLTAIAFGGGVGVTINVLFGGVLAHAMLLGLFFEDLQDDRNWPSWLRKKIHQAWAGILAAAVPLVLFSWIIIPLADTGSWRPVKALLEDRAAQQRFQEETKLLASQPGKALCESLLRCYYAHKPYVYDPFNATRLIILGKLNPQVIASQLERQEFGAVQLERPIRVQYGNDVGKSRFAPTILRAVEQYYAPVLENEDGVIYLPKRTYAAANAVAGK
ncbi:MAG: hypothetical protein WAL41_07690 [Mycobacterium sp.]